MEALKQNFLLRGYFKKRGYEDSADLAKDAILHLPEGSPLKTFTYEPKRLFDKIDTAKLKNEGSLGAAGNFLTFDTALVEKPEPAGLDDASRNGFGISVPEAVESVSRASDHKTPTSCRTDSGKLHRVRHGILSRDALAALVQLGEDPRTLRRLERQYRAGLQPAGPLGDLLFDRFWSSYLRLMLIGCLETGLMRGKSVGKRKLTASALVPGPQPTLVCEDSPGQPFEVSPLMEELPQTCSTIWSWFSAMIGTTLAKCIGHLVCCCCCAVVEKRPSKVGRVKCSAAASHGRRTEKCLDSHSISSGSLSILNF